ncbi:oxysterol-binding protein-related protein 9-like [Lampetra planeri]
MNMVESIKHCIVLLQIAKSSLNPVEAVRGGDGEEAAVVHAGTASGRPELTRAGSHGTAGERQAGGGTASAESRPTTLDVSSPAAPSLGIAKSPPAPPPPHAGGSGNGEDGSGSSGGGGDDDDDDDFEEEAAIVLTSPRDVAGVPHISYSSSEDEFYDANDSDANDSTSPKPPRTSLGASGLKHPATTESLVSIASGCTNDERYDAQDENDSEEGESVEDHKSVIMHLLSQVKLGMDLTKVVLPTFILERRSLLEMYADFFAHPDLFVSVAGGVDARERMVGVVRWYLSSFHAGRKGSVAKKPYNPILGETFHCHWTVSDHHHHQQQQHQHQQQQQQHQQHEVVAAVPAAPAEETSELAADGPVPWATTGSVTFVAEQVSHHPPSESHAGHSRGAHGGQEMSATSPGLQEVTTLSLIIIITVARRCWLPRLVCRRSRLSLSSSSSRWLGDVGYLAWCAGGHDSLSLSSSRWPGDVGYLAWCTGGHDSLSLSLIIIITVARRCWLPRLVCRRSRLSLSLSSSSSRWPGDVGYLAWCTGGHDSLSLIIIITVARRCWLPRLVHRRSRLSLSHHHHHHAG